MLLHTEDRAVTTTRAKTSTFTIAANGKAFKILIDGLYSDKEWAIVRELSTNAWDSHAMAGKTDQPFTIHAPTRYEPWFSVRDFGVGMSPEYMATGYTQVFHSTKDHANDQVGAFGLGRMTPFSKTDTFTVTSWFDGYKRTYSVFLDERRVPALAMLGEEVSSDPTGVEIQIAVDQDDFYAFKSAIIRACTLGFPVRPIITGENILPPVPVAALSGTGWRMLERGKYGAAAINKAHAVQGCVAYPIDANVFDNLPQDLRNLLNQPLVIDFNIGDLEVTASRESLSYDEVTKKAIIDRLECVLDEYLDPFNVKLSACRTMWEAYCTAYAMTSSLGGFGNAIVEKLRWKGKKIQRQISVYGELDRYTRNPALGTGMKASFVHGSDLMQGRKDGRRVLIKWEPQGRITLSPDATLVLVEDPADNLKNPGLRIRYWADQGNRTQSILWLKGDLKSYALKRVLAKLGRPTVVNIADLPKPPRDGSAVSGRTRTKMKVFYVHSATSSTTTDADLDPSETHIYLMKDRGDILLNPERPSSTVSETTLRRIITSLRTLGYLDIQASIVLVPQTHKRVPVRHEDTWTHLFSIVKRALGDFSVDEYIRASAATQVTTGRANTFCQLLDNLHKKLNRVEHEGPMLRAQKFYRRMTDVVYQGRTQIQLGELYRYVNGGYPDEATGKACQIERLAKAHADTCYRAYPMLRHVNPSANFATSTILDYVNLVDEMRLKRQSVSTTVAA